MREIPFWPLLTVPLQVDISTAELASNKTVEGWFPMKNKQGKELRGGGRLKLKLTFEGSNAEACPRQPVPSVLQAAQ